MGMAAETTAISFRKILKDSSISWAERTITKWDLNTSPSPYTDVISIFLESRDEARRFLFAVQDLQRFLESSPDTDEDGGSLFRNRLLMETAMARLQKEFAEILQHNSDACPLTSSESSDENCTFRSYLPGYGSDGEISYPEAALEYLRAIADCMFSSGYGRECVDVYKSCRRSVIEEVLSRLGLEHVSSSQVQKIKWESLDFRIKQWLAAGSPLFEEVFTAERVLCDSIFGSDESVADSCFAEITRDVAVEFFRFPYVVASKNKKPHEKLVHFLNMYRSIVDLSPEIETAFSSKSTNMVRSQVDATLSKLSVTVRSMLSDFEAGIHRDSSRSVPANGGLHLLSKSVMNHLVNLADYADLVAELYADEPLPSMVDVAPLLSMSSSTKKLEPIEEEGEEEALEEDGVGSSASSRFVWLITILLCKLDVKAELYKEASLSYLFLANNHQYVVNKVRESKLAQILGHKWLSDHEAKARMFARSFLKMSWKRVLEIIPGEPSALVGLEAKRDRMVQFNKAFEEACKSQVGWVVLDCKVREEIKSAVARNLLGRYRPFYEMCRTELRVQEGLPPTAVRFAPEDLMSHLTKLYRDRANSLNRNSNVLELDFLWVSSGSSGKRSRWKWLRDSKLI